MPTRSTRLLVNWDTARQGANMVTGPCEDMVTNPAQRAPAGLRTCLLTSMSKQRCASPILPVYIKLHQEI